MKREFKRNKRPTSNQKQPSDLEAQITHPFLEDYTPFDVISAIINLDALGKIIVEKNNFLSQQNGRQF